MRPLIICPTQYEHTGLRRALGLLAERADWICSGPGPAAIAQLETEDWPSRPLVVLAGLAGCLQPGRLGEAWWISAICCRDPAAAGAARAPGDPTTPGSEIAGMEPADLQRVGAAIDPDQPSCRLACVAAVTRGAARDEVHRATGALLVDLESAAFAAAALKAGATWAVVRGASDGPDLELPAAAERWISPEGRTRTLAVARHVVRNPGDLWRLVQLGRTARAALRGVGRLVGARIAPTAQ